MNKLLVIGGPTATGKTTLALHLAKVLDGELVSADSRQVYKKLDIGTGKDLPKSFEFRISDLEFNGFEVGYYTDGKIRLWGYDLVEPTSEFSVGHFIKIVTQLLKDIWKRGKLPILVGGTGFYIKGVIDGIPTAFILPDKKLRSSLKGKNVNELFEILTRVDPIKAASMNQSDKKNPRRLIRAIEVEESGEKEIRKKDFPEFTGKDVLLIGLKGPINYQKAKIKARVQKRISQGLLKEIESLLVSGVSWEHPSMNSLGYRQWQDYFKKYWRKKSGWKKTDSEVWKRIKEAEYAQVIEKWIIDEIKYAKRQMTWFEKEKRIFWFDVSKTGWQKNIEKLACSWYSTRK